MRFWDSSAIVPLLIAESASSAMAALTGSEEPMYVWWGSRPEIVSAIVRRERFGQLSAAEVSESLRRLLDLSQSWRELMPSERVRDVAERLLRSHDMRTADSLQLAAALEASAGHATGVEFVCLDIRLRHAAAREGLQPLPETI